MDDINWGGLVNRTNPFAEYSDGLQRGVQMRDDRIKIQREHERRKAYNLFATDPKGAETALMSAGDIDGAETIRKRRMAVAEEARRARVGGMVAKKDYAGAQAEAMGGGDFDMAASIANMDSESRKAARERSEDLGGFALAIKGQPYEQRKAIIAQARPILMEQGFTPEQIAAFDPTDANIQSLVASATDLKTALEQADRQADNQRADSQASETARHNRASEGQGNARIGIARSRESRVRNSAAVKPRVLGAQLPEGY